MSTKKTNPCLGCGITVRHESTVPYCPDCQESMEGECLVLAIGTPFEGIDLYGPFQDAAEIKAWKKRNSHIVDGWEQSVLPVHYDIRTHRPHCETR